ncbi:MAG TPA: S1 RNA-binding domain-containing protein, partial [Anaerolineales bacterium]|nr:S1 RNA-binding domain-containing protein [Anaerolineales bacterium]
KDTYRDIHGGPPPMDDSWWEAVMAEDESEAITHLQKSSEPVGYYNKPPVQRPCNDNAAMDWEKAQQLYGMDQTIDLCVTGYNRGGLLVEDDTLQGFVPISHLVEMQEDIAESEQEAWLARYVGQTLTLKVIECDQSRGRVVFSERAALSKPGSRNILLGNLSPGMCIPGTVTNITDFGVFVDLGGVEGLIHVSEISWGRVRHPRDVVKLGCTVNVYVIQVNRELARVALSLKRLYPNPWETAEERYHPGQLIGATVTSIVPFGAFARLEEGLDGLIHVSEICPGENVGSLADLIQEGQQVYVRVLHVDGSRQRLGLSLSLEDNPDLALP